MEQPDSTEILLIWVNAERQVEREFIEALGVHDEFARPQIAERDSHQAEISAWFPRRQHILEAIIDSLVDLPDFDVIIQGADEERVPTVVFSAEPLRGRPKPDRARAGRRHYDESLGKRDLDTSRHHGPERILSTTEMAQEAAPQHRRRPDVQRQTSGEPRSKERSTGQSRGRGTRSTPSEQSKFIPTLKKVVKVIFSEPEPTQIESEAPERPESANSQREDSTRDSEFRGQTDE